MRRWVIIITIIVLVVYYLRFAPKGIERFAKRREEVAQDRPTSSEDEDVVVAVVWPEDGPSSYWLGAALAAKEINSPKPTDGEEGGTEQRGIVVKGRAVEDRVYRRLRLRRFYESDQEAGIAIARKIARDPSIVAVVGHEVSKDCITQASAIYHSSGTLFIVPSSIEEAHTLHDFKNVFRVAPTVSKIGQAFVDSAERLEADRQIRVAVLYPLESKLAPDRNGGEKVVGQLLELSVNKVLNQHSMSLSVKAVFAQGYRRSRDDYHAEIEPLLYGRDSYDVVLILDVLPTAAYLRRDLEHGLLAFSEGDQEHHKKILDLEQLDWTLTDLSYAGYRRSTTSEMANKTGLPSDDLPADDLRARDVLFDRAAELVLRESKQSVAVLAQRDYYNNFYGIQFSSQILKSINAPDTSIGGHDVFKNRLYSKLFRTYEQPFNVEVHAHDSGLLAKALRRMWFGKRPDRPSYSALVQEIRQNRVEFVFIAGMGDPAIRLIKELRKVEPTVPIICGPHLETQVLWGEELKENERNNIHVVSAFDPGGVSPVIGKFVADYGEFVDAYNKKNKKKNKEGDPREPDALAAAGYQSIKLLENAFREAGTTSMNEAASALLFSKNLDEGPFGKPRFSQNGDLQGLRMVLKTRISTDDAKSVDDAKTVDTVKVIQLETSIP